MKLGRHVLSQVIYSLPKIQLNQNSETISSPKNDHPQGLLYAQTAESQTEGGGGKNSSDIMSHLTILKPTKHSA
jgi:hypothetical protein